MLADQSQTLHSFHLPLIPFQHISIHAPKTLNIYTHPHPHLHLQLPNSTNTQRTTFLAEPPKRPQALKHTTKPQTQTKQAQYTDLASTEALSPISKSHTPIPPAPSLTKPSEMCQIWHDYYHCNHLSSAGPYIRPCAFMRCWGICEEGRRTKKNPPGRLRGARCEWCVSNGVALPVDDGYFSG